MRNFDAAIVAELLKEVTSTFLLLEFQFSSTYRYTDRDIPVFYDGNKYEPLGFNSGNSVYATSMSVDRITFDIDNVSLWFSALLLGEDIRNKTAILSFGCMGKSSIQWDDDTSWSTIDNDAQWHQDSYSVLGAFELFRGFVGAWELSELQAKITSVNEFIFWKKETLRICQASCPWTFVNDGSGECRYNGIETWCDQSWNRCKNLENDSNFGGFRFLPDISEREIWWGRLPDRV